MQNSFLPRVIACFCCLVAVFSTFCTAAEQSPFELKDGDRVVFLGDRLIEQAQKHGYLETALSSRWPDRKITFQNLGWSGDTVRGMQTMFAEHSSVRGRIVTGGAHDRLSNEARYLATLPTSCARHAPS